jgi:hypothetical protein
VLYRMGGSAIRKMSKHSLKLIAAFVVLGVACVSLWFLYVPGHWLTRVGFGTVTVDDRPAQADLYIGHPAQNQAEAIAFVHVPAVGDYFLDFEGEAYREASNHEFVRLNRGVWTFRSMNKGPFGALLPFRKVNELRFSSSKGHTIFVQF